MTIVSLILAALKIIGAVMGRLDEASKRKIILAAHETLRMKVEDEQIERARAAYAAAYSKPDDLLNPGRHYRD